MLAHGSFNIPQIPALIDIDDVMSAGGRLIPENNVADIIATINAINDQDNDRYASDLINIHLDNNGSRATTNYSIIKIDHEYYAIYKGRKQSKLLGEGAFGAVKLAQNIQDGTWAAIKMVSRDEADHDNAAAIDREKNNLAKVGRLLGHIRRHSKKADTQDNILMVLAPGMTVKSIAENRIMASVKWLDLSIDITRAVADIHTHGMYHRDIKPANMLYDPANGVVTLIDFGLARRFNPNTNLLVCSRGGSPRYTAPEISKKADRDIFTYSEKTEVYALGVTLLDVFGLGLNGREIEISKEFLAKVTNPELRRALIASIKAMISRNPDKRPDLQAVITTLLNLRANTLDIFSKINSIAYLDADDYMLATKEQKEITAATLQSADKIYLCAARSPHSEAACMHIKHELEGKGVVVANTALDLDTHIDLAVIAPTLKAHAEQQAQSHSVIYTSVFVQASKQAVGAKVQQIQRSINRVPITQDHQTIATTNVQKQIERLGEKNPLDPRLECLRQFQYEMEHGFIKTYQQLFNALAALEHDLLYTPNQSKVGGFAKHHGLYHSTSAQEIVNTNTDIRNDVHGIRPLSPIKW